MSCKDENNNDVDWYIVYKLPKIDSAPRGSHLNEGKAYAFLTSAAAAKWQLSAKSVQDEGSIFGRTWAEYDRKRKSGDIAYLFYNDDPPETVSGGTAIGHLKGVVAFDGTSGFWLIHSAPRFGDRDKFEYPHTALVNGQTALCISLDAAYLNDICNHLIFCNPNIYHQGISSSILKKLDRTAKTLFTEKPAFIRKQPFLRQSVIKSRAGETFHTFAKDNQLKVDIYSDILALHLNASLIAETWRRGAGTFLPPSCLTSNTVTDVISVAMVPANYEHEIAFKSTEDHSKWAIALDRKKAPWVCIGDLNRMASQARRGGGAVCFKCKGVWTAYRSTIVDTGLCPD